MLLRSLRIAALAAACAAPAGAAGAQAPDSDDSRYSFSRAGEGYLRLDMRTGQVSHCHRRQTGWACVAAPDERAALEAEISRLQKENAALKKEMVARDMPLPDGVKAETPPRSAAEQPLRLPEGADVKSAMDFVGRVWRRLVDLMISFQTDVLKKS